VKDASAQLSEAQSKLLRAQEDLRAAKAGGRNGFRGAGDGRSGENASGARPSAEESRSVAEVDRATSGYAGRTCGERPGAGESASGSDRGWRRRSRNLTAGCDWDAERTALQVQQAQHEVAALQDKVRNGWITAPVDGTLYSQPAKAGDFVKLGDLLAEMADLHKVSRAGVYRRAGTGRAGTKSACEDYLDALPNQSWAGKTEIIPKQVVARGSRSVGELLCSVNNDKLELLPNTNVNVRINSKERLGVLAVPRGAVEAQGGRRYVFV